MPDLPFVIGPGIGDESSLALNKAMGESAIEIGSIVKEQLTDAMRLPIDPLSLVDNIGLGDRVGWIWLSPFDIFIFQLILG